MLGPSWLYRLSCSYNIQLFQICQRSKVPPGELLPSDASNFQQREVNVTFDERSDTMGMSIYGRCGVIGIQALWTIHMEEKIFIEYGSSYNFTIKICFVFYLEQYECEIV